MDEYLSRNCKKMKGTWARKHPSMLKEQRRPMSQKLVKEEKVIQRWFAELKSVPLDQECRPEVKCSPTYSKPDCRNEKGVLAETWRFS